MAKIKNKNKFLFFLERELHIPVLQPLWEYIIQNNIGEIAIFYLPYKKANEFSPPKGIKKKLINQFIKKGIS